MTKQQLNIERAVLSSIIFEPDNLDYITTLKAKEFTLPEHQQIFSVMKKLHNAEKPVTEDFILKELGTKYEFNLIDILAALPITNIKAHIESIQTNYKKQLLRRKLTLLADIDENTDLKHIISNMEHLIHEVENTHTSSPNKDFTIGELLEQEFPETEKFFTNIGFLDDIFKGFELGHLISITGEQESGKTQLTNQILLQISKQHKSLYFSLEFNKRKLRKYMQKKTDYNLYNIYAVTQDMINGDIDEICRLIKYHYKNNHTKIIAIDSQMMLFDESKKFNTTEEAITSIFRKLHKLCNTLDIIIFVIAQSSKIDNKSSNSIEIFGSKKASHLADIQLHIFNDRDNSNDRNLWIGKNKQNGIRKNIKLVFDRENLEFREVTSKRRSIDNIIVIEDNHTNNKSKKVINDARSKYDFID